MLSSFDLWLEYVLRFSHLVAGIAWIGSSFYFIWLDASFEKPKEDRHNVDGELYMVHGGFYYQVDKKRIYPGELPETLHWFKWEATLTWVTGFLLLAVLYYLRGASLLIDPQKMQLTQLGAVGLSLAILILSWLIYDFIWNQKFIKSSFLSSALSVFFLGGLIFLNTEIFSGRGAFIQTGAVFGTLMLLNVWIRILPGQTKMIEDAENGKVPDYSFGLRSKVRSVHNTYFIFPVLFIMLSNHYPLIYNHKYNWALLIVLSVSAALVRHAMVTKVKIQKFTILPATIGVFALIYATAQPNVASSIASGTVVEFSEIQQIFEARCLSCHGSAPTDDIFKVAPNGVVLETKQQILSFSEKVWLHVVEAKSMPLANKTKMTDVERQKVGAWLKAQ